MGFFIIVGWIIVLAVVLSIVFHKEFSDLLLPIANGIILILYFGGLLKNLKLGVATCILLTIALFVYSIYIHFYKGVSFYGQVDSPIRNPAIWIYIFLGIGCFLTSRNMCVWSGDDLAHWALAPKEMYFQNTFAASENSFLTFKSYPPATSLWLYLGEIWNGEFSDDILFMMNQFYIFIVLNLFFRRLKWSEGVRNICLIFITILFPLIFSYGNTNYTMYSTLNVDGIMGLLLGYIIFLWYEGNHSILTRVNVYLGCAVLSLLKETGVFLVLMASFIFLLDLHFQKKKEKKASLFIALGGIMSALLTAFSWRLYLAMEQIDLSTPVKSRFSFDTLSDMLCSNSDLIRGFLKKLFSTQTFGIIKVSYPVVLIIICIGIFIYALQNRLLLKRSVINIICWFIVGMIWEIGILYLYLFKFTESESTAYSGFERYSLTFIYAVFYLALLLALKNKQSNILIVGIITILICMSIPQYTYKNNLLNKNRVALTQPSRTQLGLQISTEVFKASDKVYIIDQDSNWQTHGIYLNCLYQIYPIQANKAFFTGKPGDYRVTYSLGPPTNKNDIHSTDLTLKEWCDILQDYNYVYIAGYDKRFKERYHSLFADEISNDSLYSINSYDGTIKLYKWNENK